MRSSLNLLPVIAVVLILQAGLCPALCFARSAGPAAVDSRGARAPESSEKAPCHAASHAPSQTTNRATSHVVVQAPSRGEVPDACGMDCSRFGSAALASSATRVDTDAPTAAISIRFFGLLPTPPLVAIDRRELTSEPPPRNLLLVKNSFLI